MQVRQHRAQVRDDVVEQAVSQRARSTSWIALDRTQHVEQEARVDPRACRLQPQLSAVRRATAAECKRALRSIAARAALRDR